MNERVVTPTEAACQAQRFLSSAGSAGNPDTMAARVAVANGWTRLYLALKTAPPDQGDMTIREELDMVVIPEKAVNLLIALGWTPPSEQEQGG